MCGRTALMLAPDQICSSCQKYSTTKTNTQWKDHPGRFSYSPSTNIAPSKFTPVMFKETAIKRSLDDEAKCSVTVMPMRWGLIPFFFKGKDISEFNFSTNNCRIENIESKPMFKPSLKKGQRCVVLCSGFFEWQTTGKTKQPYFIHATQNDGVKPWNSDLSDDNNLPRLLMMAGLYSRWISNEQEVFSYSVITSESETNFSWLHHRVPAILNSFDDVNKWLDTGDITFLEESKKDADISWYKVSTEVNNSRNQEPSIVMPYVEKEKKQTKSQQLMSSWLKSAKK